MRAALATAALSLALAGPAAAQVIDANGVRAGGVVIDSRGVHAPGADISARGVRAREGGGRRGGGLTVVRNRVVATMDCRGGEAEILGNRNRLTLENCRRLSVPGNRNEITVSLVGPAEISVMGNDDAVRYRTPPGVRARVSVMGSGAKVAEAR